MSDSHPPSHSPSTFKNFVIPYDNDVSLPDHLGKEGLLQYIQDNSGLVNETDSSFFPRAVTDLEIDVVSNVNEQGINQDLKTSNISTALNKMEGRNFQPDVIASNSHQRSGPDGSPALCPPKLQGFVNSSNMSETSELFAPVRTLTFSDVESSHVEDSYVNTSRLVSTPEHARTGFRNFDYGHFQNQGNNHVEQRIESDGNDFNHHREESNSREDSPQFRQLDGEDEHELIGTGKFKPSFHGIDQEFLDNFTGKNRTSQPSFTGDIFSPLGGARSFAVEEIDRTTPPLHSPGPNSPYAKRLASQGISLTRQVDHDDNEIQFHMSPSRATNNSQTIRNSAEYSNSSSKKPIMMDYLRENMFEPIDKGPQNYMTHRNVPQNLNEYFDQEVTDDQKQEFDKQRYEMKSHISGSSPHSMNLRQGDGVEVNDNNDRPPQFNDSGFDREFTAMSHTDFEQRYLRRTQVSVKMPQATYDTLTGEFVIQDQPRHEPTGSLQDSLEDGVGDDVGGPEKLFRSQDNGVITQVMTSGVGGGVKGSKDVMSRDVEIVVDVNTNQREETVTTNSTNDQFKSDQGIADITSLALMNSNGQEDKFISNNVNTNETNYAISGPSHSLGTKPTNENQAPKTSANQHPPSISNQPSDQVSSRLLQETISKRNKANQKYVSTAPGVSKPATNQAKEFKKPIDNPPKYSTSNPTGPSTRRNIQGEPATSNNVKSKLMEQKTKPKSASTESLGQKQFKVSQSTRSSGMHGQSYPQPKSGNQTTNQFDRSQNNQNHNICNPEVAASHTLSPHSDDGMKAEARVITQVQNTSPVHEHKASSQFAQVQQTRDHSLDFQGMEDVRSQLQNMLKLSSDTMAPQDRSHYEHSEIVAGFGMDMNNPHNAHGHQTHGLPVDMSWAMFRKPNEEEMGESFPSFSSQFLVDSGNVSRSDVSLHAENQRLRDMLEKERYRRKHCEQYIQQLNMKILEIQQQLAVAVSTDKRKDLMIEQLDKQLALVVEGWRKRDAEKEELLGNIQQEKNEAENNLHKQQEMISRFEHDMSQAVDALRQEKEKSAETIQEMKEKIAEAERSKSHAEEMLLVEQEKGQLIQQECDNLREGRETMDKKLEQMQRRLHREQDEWFQREQELLQRIEEVGEKNAKILHMEKVKNEEQGKLAEEVVEKLQETSNTVKRLEMELDAALREKESAKVEIGIMEAKFENAQRVLEMDLQAQMEKQIADQILDVQTRYEKLQDEVQEKHKAQVMELSQRHSKETEKHLGVFREELAMKEDDFRKQLQEMETRLLEYRNENSELKLAKQKLESTRLEILTKLQYAMQSQWNEALSLLVSTPQRKNVNSTLTEDEGNTSSISSQPSLASVNFSLPARASSNTTPQKSNPARPPQRLDSPDRTLANQSRASVVTANPATPSKEGGAKFDEGGEKDETVENTALSHMRDFQDYMNRLAETPEWISALTRPGQEPDSQRSDISILLSTYLSQQPTVLDNQSKPSIPQQQPESSNQISFRHNQSNHSSSQPQFETTNQLPFSGYTNTALQNSSANHVPASQVSQQPLDISSHNRSELGNVNKQCSPVDPVTPPREPMYNQTNYSEHQYGAGQSNGVIFGGMVQSSSPLYEAAGLSRAVAIRPPQQGDDPYINDDNESVISSIAGAQPGGYFQGGQCFSPPTRQRRQSSNDSSEDLNKHSNRLNDDYSHLSEKMRKHETHQNDLQKYIHMLLNKPQNDSVVSKNGFTEQNESLFSQDGIDLNDTAQAAQLQKELDRIQELRERQENAGRSSTKSSSDSSVHDPSTKHAQQGPVQPASAGHANILNDDQLMEITRLLNMVKGQPETGNEHIGELLNVLKDAQKGNQPEVKGSKTGAQRPRPQFTATTKKNVQFHPGKAVEGPKTQADNPKADKSSSSAPRSAQSKKIERKIAGSVSKGDKGGKPGIWK